MRIAVIPLLVTLACAVLQAVGASSRPDAATIRAADDFSLHLNSGATHAERGRTTHELDASGRLTVTRTRGYGVEQEQAVFMLTDEEMAHIRAVIRDNRFFRLRRRYTNRWYRDGFSTTLRITANGRTHTVTIINTSQRRFSAIVNAIRDIEHKRRTECDASVSKAAKDDKGESPIP